MEQQPSSIRLIVIDIDGTLLNPEKEITPRTRAAIKAAQDAGIVVTLATGRRYYNTRPVAEDLGLEIPLILCDGGASCRYVATGRAFICRYRAAGSGYYAALQHTASLAERTGEKRRNADR